MSPEQSSKRASIYEKLALKDKLESNKQRQSLSLLTEELDKNRQIETQLTHLIEEDLKEADAKSGMASAICILVSSTRYAISLKCAEQMQASGD